MMLLPLIVFVMLRENTEKTKKQHLSTPKGVSLFDVASVVKLRELACYEKD